MYRRKRLNLGNIFYYYARYIAISNNNNSGSKSHLSTEVVLNMSLLWYNFTKHNGRIS